jgi:hypothetical protein
LKRFDAIVLALQKTDQPKVIQEWRIEDSRLRWTVHQKHSRRSLAKTVRELINRCKKRKTELAVLPSGLFALERGTVRLSGNSLLSMEKLRSRSDIKAFFDNREPIFPARTILPSPARLRGRLAKGPIALKDVAFNKLKRRRSEPRCFPVFWAGDPCSIANFPCYCLRELPNGSCFGDISGPWESIDLRRATKLPVKFPVYGEIARRPVRAALRRQPASQERASA